MEALAGLPVVGRAVLALQAAGVDRIAVVCPEERVDVREWLGADRRVRCELSFHATEPEAEAALAGRRVLRTRHDRVGPPAAYRRLLSVAPGGTADDGLTDVRTESGRRRAVAALFDACRKPEDGLVSRWLNRRVSIAISKRLVGTPARPNHITLVTFLLGAAAAAAVSVGTYGAMLAGAVAMQLNSILDGVDGELARVRFQQSASGAWLDTLSDDFSNILFFTGMALAAATAVPDAPLWAVAGWIGVGGTVVTVLSYYVELARVGSGDFYALDWSGFEGGGPGLRQRVFSILYLLVRKDFFILLLLAAAIVGVLPYMTVVVMVFAVVTALGGVIRFVRGSSHGRARSGEAARAARPGLPGALPEER